MSIKSITAIIAVARLLLSSRRIMKDAREAMYSSRPGGAMKDDDRFRLVTMESRVRELEARLKEAEGSVRKLTTAIYALGAVSAAALALAVIKMA